MKGKFFIGSVLVISIIGTIVLLRESFLTAKLIRENKKFENE